MGAAESTMEGDAEIKYAGFLVKQGKIVKNWKNRWFELGSDQRLKYFRQSPGNKPSVAGTEAGIINLRHCSKVLKGKDAGLKKWGTEDVATCFALVLPHRTFYLYAAHANEAADWQTYIELYCGASGAIAEDGETDPGSLSESESESEEVEKAPDTFSSLSANLMADSSVDMKRSKSIIRGRLDTGTSKELARESLAIARKETSS